MPWRDDAVTKPDPEIYHLLWTWADIKWTEVKRKTVRWADKSKFKILWTGNGLFSVL